MIEADAIDFKGGALPKDDLASYYFQFTNIAFLNRCMSTKIDFLKT